MKPTIGRVVLYNPLPSERDHEHEQMFQATVSFVYNDGDHIAIGGFNDRGQPYEHTMVKFYDDTECPPGAACWMEYQKAQEAVAGTVGNKAAPVNPTTEPAEKPLPKSK